MSKTGYCRRPVCLSSHFHRVAKLINACWFQQPVVLTGVFMLYLWSSPIMSQEARVPSLRNNVADDTAIKNFVRLADVWLNELDNAALHAPRRTTLPSRPEGVYHTLNEDVKLREAWVVKRDCELPGDLDHDCDVDFADYARLAHAWIANSDDAYWSVSANLSPPFDTIDYADLSVMANHWLYGKGESIPFEHFTLEANGGTYAIGNSASLVLPPGALGHDQTLSARLIPEEEIAPFLDQGRKGKRFLAAIEFSAADLVLDLPVQLSLGSEPLDTGEGELPYLFYLNRKTGILIPDLPSGSMTGLGVNTLGHFAAMALPVNKYFEVDCASKKVHLRDITEFPPEDWIMVMAAQNRVLNNSDCINTPCRCCKFRVKSASADYASANKCANVKVAGEIEYLDCENQPKETWEFEEQTLLLDTLLSPNKTWIHCSERSLLLDVDVYDIYGEALPKHEIKATSSNTGLLAIERRGPNQFTLVRGGEGVGSVTVTVDAGCQITEDIVIQVGAVLIEPSLSPDKTSLQCAERFLLLDVDAYGSDDKILPDYEIEATSSNPNLLAVKREGPNQFALVRVGQGSGSATVTLDAGCEITEDIVIQVGCEMPTVTGRWSKHGTETWSGCQEPDDDGPYTYPGGMFVNIDSQTGSTFSGSFSYEEEYEEYDELGHVSRWIETYTEAYNGEIRVDCGTEDQCAYKVTGTTEYTHKFEYLDQEPTYKHYTLGGSTFSGTLKGNVMSLSTSGGDTSGDTCQTRGTITLSR